MAVMNVALLAAVLPAVFAIPQHGHLGHYGLHKRNDLPSGVSTGFPYPSGVPGSVPYPANNSTSGIATGTGVGGAGSGPYTITSTLKVIPQPLTHTKYAPSATEGAGEAGASGSPGSGFGSGENGAECGPATVTVTTANTVTVTVGGSNGGPSSEAPVQSSPAAPPAPAESSSASYPVEVSSAPVESASAESGSSSVPAQMPVPVSSSSSAPVEAPSSAVSSPVSAAPSSSVSSPAAIAPTSSVEAHAYNHIPVAGGQENHPPAASTTPVNFPSPVASATSSAPVSSSAVPVKSASGGKARGLLYGGAEVGTAALSSANTFLEGGSGAMGWAWNWDSSPAPQSGHATGDLNVEFVPMLLSTIDVHTSLWDENSAGHAYLMGFNEPDMTTDKGGSQMDVSSCVSNWMKYMQPKSGASKLISPATTNNLDDTSMGIHYMTNFLEQCKAQGCTFDVLAFHYYGDASDLEYFKMTVGKYKELQTQYGIPELWIPEMAPNQLPTEDQMKAFLEFLDSSESGVARYAFNGLNTGTGQNLNNGVIKSCYQS